jgi:type II secretory pathway predicted ATPase ExeA
MGYPLIDKDRAKIIARVIAGRSFLVKTDPASRYLKELTTWLSTGSQGAIVYGRPRLGKTSATRWVLSKLPQLLGSVPTIEVPIRGQNIPTENSFFQYLLTIIKHQHTKSGNSCDKRNRFTDWLVIRAQRSPINTAILFFDEAQLLTDQHYDWLLNIGNELDQCGCRLFCLLIGQRELLRKKAKLIDDGKEQIVGRFMVRTLEFSGIKSEAELTKCLTEYNNTVYPMGSAICFPSNFIPLAVSSGFQLQDMSPGIWACFREKWEQTVGQQEPAIAMQYITSTLMGLLNSLADRDNKGMRVSSEQIEKAVSASGYLESLLAMKAGSRH